MRRTPDDSRQEVLDLWTDNFTYKQISQKLQKSNGNISDIINKHREKNPDLEDLRKLSCLLKKNDLNIFDTIKAAKLTLQLEHLGVNFPTLESYISTSKYIAEQNQTDEQNFIQAASNFTSWKKRRAKPMKKSLEISIKKL